MKSILLTLFTFILLFDANSQDKEVFAFPCENPLTIDGVTSDWTYPINLLDKATGISWCIMNDKDNVYFVLQSLDQSLQQKFMRSGMTVSISSKGKSKIKASVIFPQKSSPQPAPRAADGGSRPDRQQMRNAFIESSNEMKVKGFQISDGLVPNINESGISAAFSWEAQFLMSYELKIPLKELYGESFDKNSLSDPLSLKIVVNPMPQPSSSGTQGGSRGGRGGGGGRGGVPPGGAGAPGGGQSQMFNPTIFKTEVVLNTGW